MEKPTPNNPSEPIRSVRSTPSHIDIITPMLDSAEPVSTSREIVTEPSTLVIPPLQISAKDSCWGEDPDAFWKGLAKWCEEYDSRENPADLIEFANALSTVAPESVQPWLQPIKIPENAELWIIGDLHGDLLSFRALTEFAKKTSVDHGRDAAWCFLGDLFDDGPYGHAVLREVLRLVDHKSGFFVIGNHDLALRWDSGENHFDADVSPHDFADWLNKNPSDSAWRKVAMSAIAWFRTAPRALLLGDGTLVAHGGCIHADRLALLTEQDGPLHPEVLEDLVWLRAHENSKRKIPNRTARGCQFGIEDFRDFLDRISQVAGLRIQRVIRGHDHIPERWASPPRYEGKLVTLNAMSWRQREPTGPFVRRPVIARYRSNEFPEIFQVEIPEEHIRQLYGEKGESQCSTSEE